MLQKSIIQEIFTPFNFERKSFSKERVKAPEMEHITVPLSVQSCRKHNPWNLGILGSLGLSCI